MPVFNNILAGAAGSGGAAGYKIDRSLRFDSSSSSYLNRAMSSGGNRKKWTWSGWVKRSGFGRQQIFGSVTNSIVFGTLEFDSNDRLNYYDSSLSSDSSLSVFTTSRVFRDPSAWLHIVIAVDSVNSTAADRCKVYINGVREEAFAVSVSVVPNVDGQLNSATQHNIGSWTPASSSLNLNAYLADVQFVDGQALAATDFGEYDDNNVWQPKEFTGDHNFTPTVTYPAVYISSPGAYGVVTDVNTVNGSVFSSAGSAGAGSIKVEFESAITGVTHVKFKGGAYSLNAGFSIKVNGSTTHTGLTTNSSYGVRTEALSSATDITSFEIVSTNDGWALGDLQFSTDGTNFTAPSGTAAVIPTAGVNGFHLDFSDNSSNAALGTDSSGNSNDWTVNNLTHAAGVLVSGGKAEAVSFDGTDDSLNYSSDTNLEPGTGNFTLECFVYRHTGQISMYYGQSSGNMGIRVRSNGALGIERRNTAFDLLGSAGDVPDNQWSHIAVTRHAGTIRTYVNGSQKSSASNSQNYTGTFSSGKTPDAFDEGAVASLHFVKGTALYTGSSYTVPTTISSHANTKLLCCQSASSATAATVKPSGVTISTSGSPTAGPFPSTEGVDVDSLIDTPTNYEADSGNNGGNYCTWSSLDNKSATLSNGNLEAQVNDDGAHFARGTIAVSSGKWYFEFTKLTGTNMALGVAETTGTGNLTHNQSYYYYANGGTLYGNSSGKASSWSGSTLAVGDVLGVALDMDNGTLQYYKNGSLIGTAWTGLTGKTLAPAVTNGGGTGNNTALNAGQRPFAISSVPTGFKSLCTTNLDDPLIADGSDHFDVVTYIGNGSTKTISDFSFSPDWVWIKEISGTKDHNVYDTIRGATKELFPNGNSTENTLTNGLTSFNSDGYTFGSANRANGSGQSYVNWVWNAGSSTDTNNTDGTITPTGVRANQSAGFSIVSYTGSGSNATVGHGLNAAPHMYIVKNRSNAYEWGVYHIGIGTGAAQNLNYNNNNSVSDTWWNNTAPTSSVFSIGTYAAVNQNNSNFIAYCFAPVSGYSSFGSWTGNGSTDGPFVYTGHRSRFILIKALISGEDWVIIDTERETYNTIDSIFFANTSDQELTNSGYSTDILSNGFKLRNTNPRFNSNGETYVFASFAEHPFKTARAR